MLDFLLPGSRYAEREPIGLEQIIRTAPRDQFAAFYRDWYTPERSVVVVAAMSIRLSRRLRSTPISAA